MEEMLGELCLGHVYVGGGDMAATPTDLKTGLLGADYTVENGRYRFARIYRGEDWNPDLRAPLITAGGRTSRRASTCWPSTARNCAATTMSIASSRGRPASSRDPRRPQAPTAAAAAT